MSTDTDTEPDTKVTYVTIPFRNATDGYDKVSVVAEATDTPGLVVTPTVDRGGFAGGFRLTHADSGLSIPIDMFGADVDAARRIAAELGKLGIDWTQPPERITAALAERKTDVRAALSRGRWTYEEDSAGDDADREEHKVGEYPRTITDATAANTVASLIRDALQRTTDGWDLIRYDRENTAARDRHLDNMGVMLADYGLVAALQVLMQIDPVAADGIARDIWNAYDAGDSIHEELATWGEKYGIPVPKEISARAKRAIADTRPKPAAGPTQPTETAEAPAAG